MIWYRNSTDKRLTLTTEDEIKFKLTEDPFAVNPEEVSMDLQLKVIELQCSAIYKTKHREGDLLDFYKSLDKDKWQNLRDAASQVFCAFCRTYIYEQTFSVINFNKKETRSCFTDEHLEDIFKTLTSNMIPDYGKLVSGKRGNVSHWSQFITILMS